MLHAPLPCYCMCRALIQIRIPASPVLCCTSLHIAPLLVQGIGFKSVFRVTDAPEVHSRGFHISFDLRQHGDLGFILPTWLGGLQGLGTGGGSSSDQGQGCWDEAAASDTSLELGPASATIIRLPFKKVRGPYGHGQALLRRAMLHRWLCCCSVAASFAWCLEVVAHGRCGTRVTQDVPISGGAAAQLWLLRCLGLTEPYGPLLHPFPDGECQAGPAP